jgi:hypothetical protein
LLLAYTAQFGGRVMVDFARLWSYGWLSSLFLIVSVNVDRVVLVVIGDEICRRSSMINVDGWCLKAVRGRLINAFLVPQG